MAQTFQRFLASTTLALVAGCGGTGTDTAQSPDDNAAGATALPASPAGTMRARPNIVMILVDDLRWDEFGLAGHPM